MELSVMDRLLILNLDTLPKVGSIVTMKIKQQLLADVGFTEREIMDYEIKQDGDRVTWKPEALPVHIEIGPEAQKMLIAALEKSESLDEWYVALYDRIKEGGNHNSQVEGADVA